MEAARQGKVRLTVRMRMERRPGRSESLCPPAAGSENCCRTQRSSHHARSEVPNVFIHVSGAAAVAPRRENGKAILSNKIIV